jgi:hypothetical protein
MEEAHTDEVMPKGSLDGLHAAIKARRADQDVRDRADLITRTEMHRKAQVEYNTLRAAREQESEQRMRTQADRDDQERCRRHDAVSVIQGRHDAARSRQQTRRQQHEHADAIERQHESQQYWYTMRMMGNLSSEQMRHQMAMYEHWKVSGDEAMGQRMEARLSQEQRDTAERSADCAWVEKVWAGDHERQCLYRQLRTREMEQHVQFIKYNDMFHREQEQIVAAKADEVRREEMVTRAKQEARDMTAFCANQEDRLLQTTNTGSLKRQRPRPPASTSQDATRVHTDRANRHATLMEATSTRQDTQDTVTGVLWDKQTLRQARGTTMNQHTSHPAELGNQLAAVELIQATLKKTLLHGRDEEKQSEGEPSSLEPCRVGGPKVQPLPSSPRNDSHSLPYPLTACHGLSYPPITSHSRPEPIIDSHILS